MKRFALIVLCLLLFAGSALAEETNWFEMISLFGIVDARAGYRTTSFETDGLDDVHVSDIYLYGAGLGAEAVLNEYLSGNIFFYFEEGFADDYMDTYLDEATISLSYKGFMFEAGKKYLPVGFYGTFAVSDPLVLELTETWKTTMGLGYAMEYFGVSAWAFNGDYDNVDEDGEPADDAIDGYAARLDVYPLAFQDTHSLALGGYFLSDATETSLEMGNRLVGNYESDVPLYGGYLNAEFVFSDFAGMGLVGEVAATGAFDKKNYLDYTGEETGITAVNVEAAALLLGGTVQFGPKYESISGLDWLGTQGNDPDYEVTSFRQMGGFAGYDPWSQLHLGLEVMSGGDNEDNRQVSAFFQTAVEF
ncbi:MAG TPA: hypothetical protein PKW95_19065 [bacterium]|nr:hypothetical protein [bacterium]